MLSQFLQSGNPGSAKVDQYHGALAVDQNIFRFQILMHHFQSVKRSQPAGYLFCQLAHGFQARLRVVQ